jgi:hypothetical protein
MLTSAKRGELKELRNKNSAETEIKNGDRCDSPIDRPAA